MVLSCVVKSSAQKLLMLKVTNLQGSDVGSSSYAIYSTWTRNTETVLDLPIKCILRPNKERTLRYLCFLPKQRTRRASKRKKTVERQGKRRIKKDRQLGAMTRAHTPPERLSGNYVSQKQAVIRALHFYIEREKESEKECVCVGERER